MNYKQIERRIMKQSFPKLSDKDLKSIFSMYPNIGQSDSRITLAQNIHLELERRYPV
jgi:hypothetical protein